MFLNVRTREKQADIAQELELGTATRFFNLLQKIKDK